MYNYKIIKKLQMTDLEKHIHVDSSFGWKLVSFAIDNLEPVYRYVAIMEKEVKNDVI